jgi:hypothetical protein
MSAFETWLRKEHPLIATATKDGIASSGPFGTARTAMELAWDAAIRAALDAVVQRDGVGITSDAIAKLRDP